MISNSQATAPSIGDIARSLFRHTRNALAVFILVVLATLAWIIMVPGIYQSTAKLHVKVGREINTLDPSATTGQVLNIQQTFESEFNSLLVIMGSEETAKYVVEKVGVEAILEDDLPAEGDEVVEAKANFFKDTLIPWVRELRQNALPSRFDETDEEQAIRQVKKRSSIYAPKNSNVIQVSYQAGHPKLAQLVTQALLDGFVTEHLRITKNEGSLSFFLHKTESLKLQLESVEEDLTELMSASKLVSVGGQQTILEEEAKSIRGSLLSNRTQLESTLARMSELGSILKDMPKRISTDVRTATNSQGWYSLKQRLFELQIREQELKSRFSDENAEVIAVIQQRIAAEKILAEQEDDSSESVTSTNPTFVLFQQKRLDELAMKKSLLAEKVVLQEQRDDNLAQFIELNKTSRRISDLERQRGLLEDSYLASASSLAQAKLLLGLGNANVSSISDLQKPSFSSRPVGLRKLHVLLLGGFVGMVLAIVTLFVSEYFDRSFATVSQVESALDIPVLVSIPHGRRQLMEVN